MNLQFDRNLAKGYHSKSQIIRILSEAWIIENIYCPRCGNSQLEHFPNNRSVADFYCPTCWSEYELKSKSGVINKKIVDGSYNSFIKRITSNKNPDFFILSYHPIELCVDNLWIVPKYFFVPDIVEQRIPLSANARRAGWIGCNILFNRTPEQGKIRMVCNRSPIEKDIVISQVQHSELLSIQNIDARGWLMDVLFCVNQISSTTFTLNDVYRFEPQLSLKHPYNSNIRSKIRQQLQLLRDKGFLEFMGQGVYKKLLRTE